MLVPVQDRHKILSHRTKSESPLDWDGGLYSKEWSSQSLHIRNASFKKKKKRLGEAGCLGNTLGKCSCLRKKVTTMGKNLPLIGGQLVNCNQSGLWNSDYVNSQISCAQRQLPPTPLLLEINESDNPGRSFTLQEFSSWPQGGQSHPSTISSSSTGPAFQVKCLLNEPRVGRANQQGQAPPPTPKDHVSLHLREPQVIFLSECSLF